MLEVAFYKGKHRLFDRAVQWWTRGPYSHTEVILERTEAEVEIEILPNGEVRARGQTSNEERGGLKPLTMREDLGGEYAVI